MRHSMFAWVLPVLLLGATVIGGLGPAGAGEDEALDAEALGALVADAAAISPRYMRTLLALGPQVDLREALGGEADVPLTAAVIALAGGGDLEESDWRWLDAATPRDFVAAIYPVDTQGGAGGPKHAKASVLHAEHIRSVDLETRGRTARGTVEAQVDRIYKCVVTFRAERTGDGWRIVEFALPASRVRTALVDGRWQLHAPRRGSRVNPRRGSDALTLPELGTVGQEPPQGTYALVTVTKDGDVFFQREKERISIEQLRLRLSVLAGDPAQQQPDGSSKLVLLLDIDRSIPWAIAQWLMQTAAHPAIKIYKLGFGATAAGGAEGVIAARLPRDRGGPTPPAGAPPMRKVKVKVFSGDHRDASDPRAVYAALLRLPEAERREAIWELVAPPPRGGRTPHGDVLAILEAMLAAGARHIVFEGAATPADPAVFADPAALRAHIAEWKATTKAWNTYVKVGSTLVAKDAPARDIPRAGRVERVVGTAPWGEAADVPFPWNETEILEENPPKDLAPPRRGGGFASRGTGRPGGPAERESTPRLAEKAVDAALRWLAAHQSPNGGWEAHGFGRWCEGKPVARLQDYPDGQGKATYDPGVTGLALCAFLGAGYTNRGRHPFAKVVSRGLRYLKNIQDPEGCFGPRSTPWYVYNHAMAAQAMVEAYGMTGSPIFKGSAQRALDFIALARNPYIAWRYGIKTGENDTSVSACMLLPLKAAQIVNEDAVRRGRSPPLTVDENADKGMKTWLDKVTDEHGRTGYLQRGAGPARPTGLVDRFPAKASESMTAAAAFARIMMGADPRKDATVRLGLGLITRRPPVWNTRTGEIDMMYWYWGTLAAWQAGGAAWKAWEGALRSAILPAQRAGGEVCRYEGSWDPAGPWGPDGGRVYATALMCLCCEVYYRYAR